MCQLSNGFTRISRTNYRAILMSGTALADWALTVNPIHYTVQVASALNCPETSDEMPACLRRKRLQDIMAVKVVAPPFRTPFGPVIDGTVVPNEPAVLMTTYKNLFSRYELMYGLTEVESYHLLDGVSLAQGMLEEDKSKLLKDYIRAKYEVSPYIALAKTIKQYTNLRSNEYSSAVENRNIILNVLSDARVAAPLVKTANFHSQANPKSYFYLFRHRSKVNEYRSIEKSVHGEELQYIFGIPLDSGNYPHYNTQEKVLSEYIMTLWSNFAKTGNPNAPKKHPFIDQRHREWRNFDIDWPEYNTYNHSYLSIGIPPKIYHRYRNEMMKYWNEALPEMLKDPTLSKTYQIHYTNNRNDDNDNDNDNDRNEWLNPRPILPPPLPPHREVPLTSYRNNNYDNQWDPYFNFNRSIDNDISNLPPGQMDGPGYKINDKNIDKSKNPREDINTAATSLVLTIIIFIGICFLLINLCIFIVLYYQKDKLKVRERIFNSQYRCGTGSLSTENNDDQYMKASDNNPDIEMSSRDIKNNKKKITGVKSILKSSEGIYEPVKAGSVKTCSESGGGGVGGGRGGRWAGETGVLRQTSSSTVTMDPHTKVREWIAHEIKQRCSPKFLRKGKMLRKVGGNSTDTYTDPLSSQTIDKDDSNASKLAGSTTTLQRSKAKKVSVAIDATPATRSPSVLQQIPIELTKSLDNGKNVSGLCYEGTNDLKTSISLSTLSKRPSLQRSDAVTINADDSEISLQDSYIHRSESTSLNYPETAIVHSHSISDPSPMSDDDSKSSVSRLDGIHLIPKKSKSNNDVLYTEINKNKKQQNVLGSFVTMNSENVDVNVTSRDDSTTENNATSHEDALDNIRRRNFPKVLPDFPENIEDHNQKAAKRRSLPLSSHLLQPPLEFSSASGGISPDGSLKDFKSRVPPPPPPRVSTLGRKPLNTTPVTPISSSHITVHLASKNNIIPENTTIPSSSNNSNRIQGPIPVKTPQVPINQLAKLNSFEKQNSLMKNSSTSMTEKPPKRVEPKIIIKPTMTNPVTTLSAKKDNIPNANTRQPGMQQQIPRVTQLPSVHNTEIPVNKKTEKPQIPVVLTKNLPHSQPDPNMGIGKKIKINPVKKTAVSVSTETAVDSLDDNSESNTGTIKRVKK
ncbi:uncharacterized protein LOC142333050 isoform X2 [Lycorma delicatula]|uniref:uncharacterized protein LOC142333050 isoform X2 n=1 Tax=Lycorma delicatula TaxID=130591 RepID=UPI003F51623E